MTALLEGLVLGAGTFVTLSGLGGGAAGRPLIRLRPNSAIIALGTLEGRADVEEDGEHEWAAGLLEGAYDAKTVDVATLVMVCLTVTVL